MDPSPPARACSRPRCAPARPRCAEPRRRTTLRGARSSAGLPADDAGRRCAAALDRGRGRASPIALRRHARAARVVRRGRRSRSSSTPRRPRPPGPRCGCWRPATTSPRPGRARRRRPGRRGAAGARASTGPRSRLPGPVPLRRVASAHVDDPARRRRTSRRAAAALAAADAGDEDAAFVVDAVEDHELLWYADAGDRDLLAPSTRRARAWLAPWSSAMDAVTQVPAPVNEPVRQYAPGSAERADAREHAQADGQRAARADHDHRRRAAARRRRARSTSSSRTTATTCSAPCAARPTTTPGPRSTRRGGGAGLAGDVLRRPRRDPAQGRRPARRPVARDAERRDDARPVEDRDPGRDRRRPAS